jgi:hypothetical protein
MLNPFLQSSYLILLYTLLYCKMEIFNQPIQLQEHVNGQLMAPRCGSVKEIHANLAAFVSTGT